MKRIVCPPLDKLTSLRQPLTPGEQAVLELFHHKLSDEWEIYIHPHLNGLRPDFVLLNPNVGIAVFEVKDWNLDTMHYFTRGKEIWAEKDGDHSSIRPENPITKVNLYKQEIYDLYCPRIRDGNGRKAWGTITAGVIFPFADVSRVRNLLKPFLSPKEIAARYQPVSGQESIQHGKIFEVFPEYVRRNNCLMTEDFANDLRGWLCEPNFSTTQREPLDLDRNQLALATTRTESGYRRIKGPAGSGKSQVLAARAARLINDGKSILIATYNITLWHYLRDLIVRDLKPDTKMDNVVFTHFHLWCKRTCYSAGWAGKYDALVRNHNAYEMQHILAEELPRLAEEALGQAGVERYDAILVDEGQDYRPHWWNILRKVLKPNGEMLLVADATQDIYGTSKAWTDDVMKNAGFRGPWAQLGISYRLPPVALDMAHDFAQRFLPKDTSDLPIQEESSSSFIYPCMLRWVQCPPNIASKICRDEVIELMKQTGANGLANADIVILFNTTKLGVEVVKKLEDDKLRIVNTFAESPLEQRRQKMGFFMGDARIKATTLHSFKGWEARLILVHIAEASDLRELVLFYTGLTRLKRDEVGSWLTVVCSSPELENFGKTWPSYSAVGVGYTP